MAMQPHVVLERVSNSSVNAVCPLSERRELSTAGDERHIKIWSADDGRLLRTYDAHRGSVTSLTWIPHLRFLASTSLDHTLAIWNFKGECVARTKFMTALYSSGYSARHDILVVGGSKKVFVLQIRQIKDDWEISCLNTFEEHADFISSIICTPAGRVFSCGFDGVICAFELNVEDRLVLMTAGGNKAKALCHNGAITCSSFDTETQTPITGGYDTTVKIWNYDSLTAHAHFIPLHVLSFNVTVSSICYVPPTRSVWVALPGSDTPHIFDPRTGTNLTDFIPHSKVPKSHHGDFPTKIVAAPEGGEAVTVSDQKLLCVWKFNAYACVSIIRGHTDWVEVLVRNPQSAMDFVSAGADSSVRRWHSPTALYPELYSMKEAFEGHQGSVQAGVIRHDGSMLFTGGDDGMIRGWNLDDPLASESEVGAESSRMVYEGHDGSITGLCMIDHFLISVSWDQSVRVWDTDTHTLWGDPIEYAHESAITGVDASPEFETFATCSSDGLGHIWSLEGMEKVGTIKGHGAEVSHIKWNALHSCWVTASEDCTIRMWQPEGAPEMKADSRRKQGLDRVARMGDEGEDVLIKLDTEGFSALAVEPVLGYVIAGLSDASVVVVDMSREVVLQVYKGHRDVARAIVCLPEKMQLITAGWDHSIRVWAVPFLKGKEVFLKGKEGVKGVKEVREERKGGGEGEKVADDRLFADRHPPYEPVSLKNDIGLSRFGKAVERQPEPASELSPMQKRERSKQHGHMSWVLKCIEEGNDDLLKQKHKTHHHRKHDTHTPQTSTQKRGGGHRGAVSSAKIETPHHGFQAGSPMRLGGGGDDKGGVQPESSYSSKV